MKTGQLKDAERRALQGVVENELLEVRNLIGHGYYIQWNNGRDSICVEDCATPQEAYENAVAFAIKSGWTYPKWWQFWRWNDSRPKPPTNVEPRGASLLSAGLEGACKKCGGLMKPGKAIAQTWTELPDFPDDKQCVTLSPGGSGKLINCMKCEKCGWSMTSNAIIQGPRGPQEHEMNDKTDPLSAAQVEPVVMRDREHIKKAVAALQDYMATYDKQRGYEDFTAQTFIDDVLYGLGIALDPDEHQYAQGFRLFKQKLLRHLGT